MEPITIEELQKELKEKFHNNFVSDACKWKDKLRTANSLLSTFGRITLYNYDEFCRVCYYAISDVIDDLVTVEAIEPSDIEIFALEDALRTSGCLTEDKLKEVVIRKREDKFVSLQKKMSEEMEDRMMRYLFENKFPNHSYSDFKNGLDE